MKTQSARSMKPDLDPGRPQKSRCEEKWRFKGPEDIVHKFILSLTLHSILHKKNVLDKTTNTDEDFLHNNSDGN